MRLVSFITVLLFCTKYYICELFFQDDLVNWWRLRVGLDTLNYALCFFIAYKFSKGFIRDVFMVGMVFCGCDILDRYFFSINEFNLNDLLLIMFAAIYLIPSYAREIKGDS